MNLDLPVLAPSILAADYANIESNIQDAEQGGAQWIHCDIMDGQFVPNISFGPKMVEDVNAITDAFLDVHLMIDEPNRYIADFAEAGADLITVHVEACTHLHRCIQNIKQYGVMTGVALNPATSLHLLEPILEELDLVLLMSVNPGFGGQTFIDTTHHRLQQMQQMRDSTRHNYLIEVDGGLNLDNIESIVRSGAEVLVTGSAVFNAKNIPERVKNLQEKAQRGNEIVA